MRSRPTYFRLLLLFALPVLLIGLAECWVRWQIFGYGTGHKAWRDPDLYTWRYAVDGHVVRSDDHAKLAVHWGLLEPKSDHPHSLLGWHGDLDSLTLLPASFQLNDPREPLVLLGWGWSRHHLAEELANDTALTRDHQVVDLSVEQFALDQDLMLLEHTSRALGKGTVLLWVDLDELDRLDRSFTDRPKPRFVQDIYTGVLQDVPLPADPKRYLEAHPADPGLYVYHLFRSTVLNDTVMSTSGMRSKERRLCELVKKLLSPGLHAAVGQGLRIAVVTEQSTLGESADRRRWAVNDACKGNEITPHALRPRIGLTTAQLGGMIARDLLVDGGTAVTSPLDSLINALDIPDGQLTPLQQRMGSILKDTNWLQEVRAKAQREGVPVITMIERDARYMLEHE